MTNYRKKQSDIYHEELASTYIDDPVAANRDCNVVAVYGTLRSGEYNYRLLGDSAFLARVQVAVRFRMRDMGYFPMLVPTAFYYGIICEVYRVSPDTMSLLDSLEGVPWHYTRSKVRVPLGGSTNTDAWIYHGRGSDADEAAAHGKPIVESGDWVAYAKTKKQLQL